MNKLDLYLSTFPEPKRTYVRDRYEEIAAVLEYDQGNDRNVAERLAMEQVAREMRSDR